MTQELLFPPPFELHPLGAVDSLAEAARARAGRASDGTIFLASEQRDARTRLDRPWLAPIGNLHCAIVIDCDFPPATVPELLYVGCVSAGTALASLLAAQTSLRWDWPNRLLINELRAGRIDLARYRAEDDGPPKAVVSLSVNVAHHPPQTEPERFNSVHASGSPEIDSATVLEMFARNFLRWINIWAEEGFEPIRHAWLSRAERIGERRTVELPGERFEASLVDIGAHGSLEFETDAGQSRSLSVARYLGVVLD